ncbi:MAG: transcriptional regulator, partial [Parabacteroides sp.]|nr:transcriptional regulator [Parabacteroides sp.]
MDILTSKCSDRFMAHVLKRRDQEAVRWYVLTLPTAGGGRDRI